MIQKKPNALPTRKSKGRNEVTVARHHHNNNVHHFAQRQTCDIQTNAQVHAFPLPVRHNLLTRSTRILIMFLNVRLPGFQPGATISPRRTAT